jgi:hypothetical protein
VSAVALNVAAYNATAITYLTAWPNGQTRPNSSNLNPRPGLSVSNLAIVKVGTAGQVSLYNGSGTIDVVVDVVGYFTT